MGDRSIVTSNKQISPFEGISTKAVGGWINIRAKAEQTEIKSIKAVFKYRMIESMENVSYIFWFLLKLRLLS